MDFFKMKTVVAFLFLTIFCKFSFCWDILRYNAEDNALYIGSTRIVSAPQNTTSRDLSFWDPSTRTLILVVSGYIYGNPVSAYNYNIASTSSEEIAGVDYFKITYDQGEIPRDRSGRIIGDYGPSYTVLFDDERQRGSAYPGYSPRTQWVSTYTHIAFARGSYERETRTGFIKWAKTISTPSTTSDTPVTVTEVSLPPEIAEIIRSSSLISIPNGSLSISKSKAGKGSYSVTGTIN